MAAAVRAVPDLRARGAAADLGRHRRRLPRRLADHRRDADPGLFLNCGWGTGGFKATPGSGWAFAETIANGEPSELAKPYALERFTTGALIDEHGAAGVAH